MAPLLNTLISRIVFGDTKKRRPDLPRPSSITFSEGDFPGAYQQYDGYSTQPSSQATSPSRALAPPGTSPDKGNSAWSQSTVAEASTLGDNPGAPEQLSSSSVSKGNLIQPHQSSHTKNRHSAVRGEVSSVNEHSQDPEEAPLQAAGGADQSAALQQFEDGTSTAPTGLQKQQDADQTSSSQSQAAVAVDTDGRASTSSAYQGIGGQLSQGDIEQVHNGEKQPGKESRGISAVKADAAVPSGPNRDDLVSLVQGTQQFIGMLQARDLS